MKHQDQLVPHFLRINLPLLCDVVPPEGEDVNEVNTSKETHKFSEDLANL